jgi:hypothetical protein
VCENINGKAKLEVFEKGVWRTIDGPVKQEVIEC